MASKQLGKLRQWGREVISSKEKTVLTEEFKETERDVDLRKVGIERLHNACSEYHSYLEKKKEYSSVETGVKMLPVDALGAVMMSHGEQFGDDSAFGQCLLKLGRAHCKIATLQEKFALTLRNTYLASLAEALEELSDYASQRKKLDSRRLAYDAAVTKVNKSKKEKEVQEAQEELNKAKLRYEETSIDVQARMQTIQDNEIQQFRDLTQFLAIETRFVEQYLDVLRDTRDEWIDESTIQPTERPGQKAPPHAFPFGRSTPSISTTSKMPVSVHPSSPSTMTPPSDEDEASYYESSARRRASSLSTSRPSSRGSSTSGGTTFNNGRRYRTVGSDDVNPGKRKRVASWASNAVSSLSVSSLSGSGRSKQDVKKDKSQSKSWEKAEGRVFENLGDAGDDFDVDVGAMVRHADDAGVDRSVISIKPSKLPGEPQPMSIQHLNHPPNFSSSASSFNSQSGSGSSATPSVTRKVMRALFDFSGSSDELTFRSGDEIVVVYEGKAGWSMGELEGRRALFPVNYTEEVISTRLPHLSMTPPMTSIAKRAQIDIASEDGASIVSGDSQDVGFTIKLYDEPFGDHHLVKSTLVEENEREHDRDLAAEIIPGDEEEIRGLFGQRANVSKPRDKPSLLPRLREQAIAVGNAVANGGTRQPPAPPQRRDSVKKPPPPLPARRPTISNNVPASHNPKLNGPAISARLSSAVTVSPPYIDNTNSTQFRAASQVSTSPFDT